MQHKKYGMFVVIIVVVGVCAVGRKWYYDNWQIEHGFEPLAFSSQAWANADADERGHMLKNLLDKHPLIGKTTDQIRSLLGQPDKGGKFGFMYHIGYLGRNKRAPLVFSNMLFIDFDNNGIVTRVYTGD